VSRPTESAELFVNFVALGIMTEQKPETHKAGLRYAVHPPEEFHDVSHTGCIFPDLGFAAAGGSG
jgi:hypothetical protein